MRILIVTGDMGEGGAQSHVSELAEGLVRSGHTVFVASQGGRYIKTLKRCGVHCIYLPTESKMPHCLGNSLLQIVRTVRQEKIDVLHAHTRIAAFLCHYAAKICGCAFVSTAHAKFSMKEPWGTLSHWGDICIAVSEDIKRHLRRYCRKVRVIPNGINTERFSPAEVERKTEHIVFVSRLDFDCSQGAYVLCRCAERLQRRFPRCTLTIVGGGSEYGRIKRFAEWINARAGRTLVRAVGAQRNVQNILREADVFVGVSRAALEAMSCGALCVLCGDEGFLGLLDEESIATAERTNFCCRGQWGMNDGALFDALCEALCMGEVERRKRERLLREYVISRHSAELMVRQTEQVYKEAVDARRGGVLLCGYYGYGNLGDEALCAAAVKRARAERGGAGLCVLTAHGKREQERYGERCVQRCSPLAVYREIRRADTVAFGGGTLFQDGTSRRSVWYYIALLAAAQSMGKRTELWGNGLEEIHSRVAQAALKRVICACDYVGLRDGESVSIARRLGVSESRIHREQDLAASLVSNAEQTEKLVGRLGIPKNKKYAVVAVKGSHGANARGLIRCVRKLVMSGVLPVYVAMYPREDMRLTRKLCEHLGGIVAPPLTPSEVIALMGGAQAVLAMRYHALIFAECAKIPAKAFGGEDKLKRLLFFSRKEK